MEIARDHNKSKNSYKTNIEPTRTLYVQIIIYHVLWCTSDCTPRYRDGAARRATAWRHGPTFITHSRAPKQRLTCASDPGYTHIHTYASEFSHLSNPHSDTADSACIATLSCLRWPWTRAAGLVHSPTHHARSAHGLAVVRARVVVRNHASRTLPR